MEYVYNISYFFIIHKKKDIKYIYSSIVKLSNY